MKAKTKQIAISSKGRENAKANEVVTAEYSQALGDAGRPFSCKVSVVATVPTGEFTLLDITEVKRTISYPYETGGIGYKTLTHVIGNDVATYGLACTPDGEIELYVLDDDVSTVYDAEFAGGMRVRRHVVDPMFAFSTIDGIYLLFNDPSESARNSGAKARKPMSFPDENMVMASGSPVVIRFSFGESEGEEVLGAMEAMPRYVVGLLDDPEGDYPLVMVANIFDYEEEDPEEVEYRKPSFGKLISSVFFEDDDVIGIEARTFPIGVSVARLGDGAKYEQVPMSGNMDYGIKGIVIAESEDGENNAVGIEATV